MKAVYRVINQTMTIDDYFFTEQPTDDTVSAEGIYKNTVNIEFADGNGNKIIITVAHIGMNLWAFGWTIRSGGKKPLGSRICSPNVTTKGDISKLMYGMAKMLKQKITQLPVTNKELTELADAAIKSTYQWYDHHNDQKYTITI